MISIKLKDGSVKQYRPGTTVAEVAESLSGGLARALCCAEVNGINVDLRHELTEDSSLTLYTFDDEAGKKAFRHTAAHIMAQAVKRLYPDTKLAIGPSIDGGFYYDFDPKTPFVPEDLEKIEAEMQRIVKEAIPIERFTLPADEALELMKDEPYKRELILEHAGQGEEISFYRQNDFTDVCAGPHLTDTGKIKAIKLTATNAAYWRGDQSNKALSRIYGTAFPKASQLAEHLEMLEEAKRRDHRKLGKELELFTILEEGPGFPFFLPKGALIKNLLMEYWREVHHRWGYVEISTPVLLNKELWLQSGHWDHYKNNMYTTLIDDDTFCVKPMNCPGGMLVYKQKPHSYKDLPLRMAEVGLVHRHEMSGALHGLMRVRCFNQDDAHIFMTKEQIKDEIKGVAQLIDEIYKTFGFEYHVELSTMPEDHMGAEEDWESATEALREAITELGYNFVINEGDGAFYGPKLDFHLTDCIGRTWQCGTIQLDFQMPERFDLEYTGPDNQKHRPVMIHRVAFGSIERFIGILIEQFAGAFPLWLSPVQVCVIPIGDRQLDYARGVASRLEEKGLRVVIDDRNEKMGYKIREAQLQKTPYMLVIGDREMEAGEVSVRSRRDGDKGSARVDDFIAAACLDVETKSL
ncbi:MAG: threonine--tRNA ligase [Oscillospiraceae bacterium]|nr:threonine--tRNA ligase [Oscillospiraceae bacterium]